MLKCVLFWISSYSYAVLSDEMEEMKKCFLFFSVQAVFCRSDVSLKQEDCRNHLLIGDKSYQRNEILFITDEEQNYQILANNSLYTIVLFHDKNRSASFPHARYGVEDIEQLEYRFCEQAYRRLAGIPWDILSTEHLLVRESTITDVEEFYRIYQEPAITYYMENLFPEHEKEMEYMEAYIKLVYGFYGYGLWTVILKETGRVIGRAGLSMREGFDLPELGFLIEVAHQKKGYGYEVCKKILEYASKELDFQQVQALVKKGNCDSEKLLGKLGFLYEREVSLADQIHKVFICKL